MKRVLGISAGFLFVGVAAFAETWSGTIVDTLCKDKDVAGHTRECALSCAKSGFGLVTADGKFIKLDEAGNVKALAALKVSKKDKDLRAKVSGALEDGVIKVESIDLVE